MDGKYIFISYSTKDTPTVLQVLSSLDEKGVAYWKAPEAIPAGSSYAREIPRAIKECSMVLLFLSSNAQASIWVEKEIDAALNCGKRLVPMLLDDAPLEDVYKFYLNNVQMIPWCSDPNKGVSEMMRYVGMYVGFEQIGQQAGKNVSAPPPANAARSLPPAAGRAVPSRQVTRPAPVQRNFGLSVGGNRPQPVKAATARPSAAPGIVSSNTGVLPVVPEEVPQKMVPPPPRRVRRKDILTGTLNRAPTACEYCGGPIKESQRDVGVFVCDRCGQKSYDDFYLIKDYLNCNGPTSAADLSRELELPRRIIRDFEERVLEKGF